MANVLIAGATGAMGQRLLNWLTQWQIWKLLLF